MKQKVIRMNVKASTAGILYTAFCIISICAMVLLWEDRTNIGISWFAKAIGALMGFLLCLFGIYTIFDKKRYSYKVLPCTKSCKIDTNHQLITYQHQDKSTTIRWDDIHQIEVITTDEGPSLCDVFFVLSALDGSEITIPQDHPKAEAITNRFLAFEGFDHKIFVEAMGSISNRNFLVWTK